MSSLQLSRRLAKLEGGLNRNDLLANVSEFRFALWIDRLPDATSLAENARVVHDFYCGNTVQNWGGKRGVIFRSGYSSQRIASDPDDHGRTLLVDGDAGDGARATEDELP